jgi:hypothetical protein
MVVPARFKAQMNLDPKISFTVTFGDVTEDVA